MKETEELVKLLKEDYMNVARLSKYVEKEIQKIERIFNLEIKRYFKR